MYDNMCPFLMIFSFADYLSNWEEIDSVINDGYITFNTSPNYSLFLVFLVVSAVLHGCIKMSCLMTSNTVMFHN